MLKKMVKYLSLSVKMLVKTDDDFFYLFFFSGFWFVLFFYFCFEGAINCCSFHSNRTKITGTVQCEKSQPIEQIFFFFGVPALVRFLSFFFFFEKRLQNGILILKPCATKKATRINYFFLCV